MEDPPARRAPGSCAASACHGSVGRVNGLKIQGNEYTTWVTQDPHAHAYAALSTPLARQIEARLAGGTGPEIAAHEDVRCLSCHATATPTSASLEISNFSPEGVSCESCHGDASRWLGEHTNRSWDAHTPETKQRRFGMTNLGHLGVRARVCAGCHIGAPERNGLPLRDVNHDLIAAGHPRMNFEFAAYHDLLPKHWTATPAERAGEFPARLWLVGQAESEAAALELLEDRARDKARPWPEFAEYGCFSCHHSLRDQEWRRRPKQAGLWGSWLLALSDDGDPHGARANLRLRMERSQPDRDTVAGLCRQRVGELAQSRDAALHGPIGAATVASLIQKLNDPAAWEQTASWDEAAQRYLALVPLHQAWEKLDAEHRAEQAALRRELDGLLEALKFGPGYSSPERFDPKSLFPVP